MGNVTAKFIQPMMRQFRMPDGAKNEPELWEKDYQRILGTFDDAILERAADLIMASRDKSTFPLPSECNRACLDALEMLAGERHRASKAKEGAARAEERLNQGEWERRSNRADELFATCQYSHAALREGWWWRLWSWMQEKQRIPDIHEAKVIRGDGMRNEAKFHEDIRDNIFAKQLKTWKQSVYNRISSLVQYDEAETVRNYL